MKSKLKSKTLWASLITGVSGIVALFVPEFGDWMKENNEAIMVSLGLIFTVLRINTDTAVK